MKGEGFKCPFEVCGKLYTTKYNLNKHVELVHWGVKAYTCDLCGKALATKQNLTQHMHTHTGARPFLCQELGCGEQFRYGSQLSIHKKLHRALVRHCISSPKSWAEEKGELPLPSLQSISMCSARQESETLSEDLLIPALPTALQHGFLPRLLPDF